MVQTTPSLKHLKRTHRELAGLFRRHQKSLLAGELSQARIRWKIYEMGLRAHLKEEEDILFPLYRQRAVPAPRGGSPDFFTGEHQKIREWLGRLRLRVDRLIGGPRKFQALIQLLDDEAFFKKYLEHHGLREDRILYPALDRLTTPKEKQALGRLLSFKLRNQDYLEDENP